jgi:cadmium resistance protein CadD (predicted permease)
MDNLIAIIPVAAVAYIATNLDNFVLLVALLARYRRQTISVIAGYLGCMGLLGLVGFMIGEAADAAPVEYLGLLGLIPISIGIVGIIRLVRGRSASSSGLPSSPRVGYSVFLAVLLTQLGNGADTVVTFGVLFADSVPAADRLIGMTLLVMAGLFVLVALHAVRHPRISNGIEQYADRVTPFILLFVGVYVLLNTSTDLMPG